MQHDDIPMGAYEREQARRGTDHNLPPGRLPLDMDSGGVAEPMSFRTSIDARIGVLAGYAEDEPDGAHGEEDAIHVEVLERIAHGNDSLAEVRELAELALKTRDIPFPRFTA
jgi:hypothetical protein